MNGSMEGAMDERITDEMVERVKAAIKSTALEMDGDIMLGSGRWYEGLARAALTAALGDVEPLEDVLGTSTVTVTRVDFGDWYSEITEPRVMKAGGHGPTIDAAVRAAVVNAKGGNDGE